MKKIILLSLLVFINMICNSQVQTKFVKSGFIVDSPHFSNNRPIANFKKGDKVKVVNFYNDDLCEIVYEGKRGYVYSHFLNFNDELTNLKDSRLTIVDSLNQVRELEQARQRRLDSLVEVEKKERERLELIRAKIRDSVYKKEKKRLDSISNYEYRYACKYIENSYDQFDKVTRQRSIDYGVNGDNKYSPIKIQFNRIGNLKFIVFKTDRDLGCASPYSSSKSYVKVRLENNQIVTFYHFNDIDCGSFALYGKLTNNDIKMLKSSEVVSIRLSGTKHYTDIEKIKFKDIFIQKLKCLE